MDEKTLGLYLSRILSGLLIFLYNNKKYKLIYPDMILKYDAEVYAQEQYENIEYNDWIQDEHIVDALISMGLWNSQGDSNLKNIEEQIEALKVDLYKNFLNPSKLKS